MPLTSFVNTKVSDNEYSENVNTECEIHSILQLMGLQFSGFTLLRLAYTWPQIYNTISFLFCTIIHYKIFNTTKIFSGLQVELSTTCDLVLNASLGFINILYRAL